MHLREHIVVAVVAVLFPFLIVGVSGQLPLPKGNSSPQASATVSPSPTPLELSSVVGESNAVAVLLRALRDSPADDTSIRDITAKMPATGEEVEAAIATTRDALAGKPSLDEIEELENIWRPIVRQIRSWKSTLQEQISALDKQLVELDKLKKTWQLTVEGTQTTDESTDLPRTVDSMPPEIRQKVTETIAAIDDTARIVNDRRGQLLAIQTEVSDLETRVSDSRGHITTARTRRLANLLTHDEPPIWASHANVLSASELIDQAIGSIREQGGALREYASVRVQPFVLQGLAFIVITLALFWFRRRVRPFVAAEPKLDKAAQIFALPVVTGLILTIIVSNWFYAQAPRMLTSLLGAAALVPVVILLRRMVERPLFSILNALMAFYFVDEMRDVLANQALPARILFLAEMAAAIVFLIWYLKSKHLAKSVAAGNHKVFTSIKKVIPFALAIFAVALTASALGYVTLGYIIGNGVLGSGYFALLIYTAVQIVRGLIIFALRVQPLASTKIVINNRPLIRERLVKIVEWMAILVWVLITLKLFSVRQVVFTFLRDVFSASVDLGSIEFSIGSAFLFVVVIWIAVLVSRFLRFVLEEDVYPRANMGPGVSYTVSTMLHYSIIVIALLIGVGILGIDFTKFALVAGAIGIGVGFGLQNIINNFVSGLILLFERPVKVGDTVQVGSDTGKLRRIGLRASVLRKVDGSDVILPNSQLISEPVINWTMSDKQRRIDIPIGVAYGTDPDLVMGLLVKTPETVPEALTVPPPKALFMGFGDNSLDFELRVWTENTDSWVVVRSDLVSAVHAALVEADIEIPFPQTDLHIRSVDAKAAKGFGTTNNP